MAKSLDRHFANKTLIHFKLLKCRRQIIRQMSEPGNEKKTDLGKSKSFRKIKWKKKEFLHSRFNVSKSWYSRSQYYKLNLHLHRINYTFISWWWTTLTYIITIELFYLNERNTTTRNLRLTLTFSRLNFFYRIASRWYHVKCWTENSWKLVNRKKGFLSSTWMVGHKVKLVFNHNPWDPKIVAVIDRWSLFRGTFML